MVIRCELKERTMNDLAISTIRTAVPAFVGAVVAILAGWGIPLDDAAVNGFQAFVFGLTTALYYLLVRLAAKKVPQLEWLLGAPKAPTYKD